MAPESMGREREGREGFFGSLDWLQMSCRVCLNSLKEAKIDLAATVHAAVTMCGIGFITHCNSQPQTRG
jgi:hypothetical protein